MNVYDAEMKVLDTEVSHHYTIRWPEFWHFILTFVLQGLYGKRNETHTHTRAHARTHARTYICKYVVSLKIIFSFFWEFLHWRLKFLNFSVNLAPIWLISPLFLKINVISIFYCYKDSVLTVRWEKWKL